MLQEDRGRALLQAGRPADALGDFAQAGCGSACLAESGDALLALGRTHEAVDLYVEAKAVGKLASLATTMVSEKRFDAALDIEVRLLRELPDDFAHRSERAVVYDAIGKIESARFSSGSRTDPRLIRKAIDAIAQASELAPLNEDYLLSYAFAQFRWGDQAEASRAFQRLLQIHPGQPDAQAALARIKGSAAAPP